jgi:spermidine synthase
MLMNSRMLSSELALAELGWAHIQRKENVKESAKKNAKVLVGGLGMGFTLAAALKAISISSQVVVAELVPEVVEWNKGPQGECAGRPLDDNRVLVHLGDVAELFIMRQATYDAVLLDVDNGPEGFTQADNNDLYSIESLQAIQDTLHSGGVLAIWSAWHDPKFTQQLKKAGFKVKTKTVRAHKGKGSRHTIYLARKI